VTSTADNGAGSLRDCMAQLGAGDVITFDTTIFPLVSPATIVLTSPLPTIVTNNVTIDGSNAGVILDGSNTPTDTDGLVIENASNVVIKGLQILYFPDDGIELRGGSNNTIGGMNDPPGGTCSGDCNLISGNGTHAVTIRYGGTMSNTVKGNYIGTDASGTVAIGNTGDGVSISDGAQYNIVGGTNTTPGGGCSGECNLISGNGPDYTDHGVGIGDSGTTNNVVKGNYIGTNVSGTAAIANAGSGVSLGTQYNVVGGNTVGERNLISGNDNCGVGIYQSLAMSNTVIGNYIGTDASGTAALGNGYQGVWVSYGAKYNVIGGDTASERNLISGNGSDGVLIRYSGTMHNTVIGNYIGTDANGAVAVPNGSTGVAIRDSAGYNVIGGDTAGEGNLISGNGSSGVNIRENGTMDNTIIGNYIGTDAVGTSGLGNNDDGVLLYAGAQRNTIGLSNTIAYNDRFGVLIVGATTLSNTITQNSIYSNTEKGIELYDGGNLELFPPIITELLSDTVSGVAPPNSTVEVFSDSGDEGRVFEGSTTADATSHFTFNKPSDLAGPHTTATATDVDGNTSEFSTAYSVTHDMKLVDIFSPKSKVQVGEAVTPTVEVGNAGSSTESSVPVQVRVTDVPTGTEVYSKTETVSSIHPLAYAVVEFDPWTPGATGTYTFEAGVTLPEDNNSANDAKEVMVTVVENHPEVYIKDNPQDDGSVPTSNYWRSPDIWVRHEEDGGEEHQQPVANVTNTVYARVHNIGDVTLSDVTVDLYWHEPALAIKCGSWRYIGQATISSLTPGATQTIDLAWTPDVSGHTCLFAQVDDLDQDPYSRDHGGERGRDSLGSDQCALQASVGGRGGGEDGSVHGSVHGDTDVGFGRRAIQSVAGCDGRHGGGRTSRSGNDEGGDHRVGVRDDSGIASVRGRGGRGGA
jgi:hypothetical protein